MLEEWDFLDPFDARTRGQALVAALREVYSAFETLTGHRPQRRTREIRWIEYEEGRLRVYAQGPGYKDDPGNIPGDPRKGWHPTDTRAIILQGRGARMNVCTDFGFMDLFNALAQAKQAGRLTPARIVAIGELLIGLAHSRPEMYSSRSHHVLSVDAVTSRSQPSLYEYGDAELFQVSLTQMWRFEPPPHLLKAFVDGVGPVTVRDRGRKDVTFPISAASALHALHLIAINEDNLYERRLQVGDKRSARIGRINLGLTTARVLAELAGSRLEYPPPGWVDVPLGGVGFPRNLWERAAKQAPPNPGLTWEEAKALVTPSQQELARRG